MAKAKTKETSEPVIGKPETHFVGLEIFGITPIIQNCFNQKAVEEMLKKQMGIEVLREKKKPRECIERAHIRNTDEVICIPPIGIKKGILTAASIFGKTLKKVNLRQQITVEGSSIPITFERMVPRMDIVRLGGMSRTPDVRFRPMFENWKARLIITFHGLQVETVVNLVNQAGKVGVCEWRPERNGTFGTYEVCRNITDAKELEEVKNICKPQLKPLVIPEWAMDAELSPSLLKKIAASEANHSADVEEEIESQEEVMTGDAVYDQEVA